ncbi:hypothetical protein CCACVL1_27981, partial [Corchorus capsularis]
MGSRIDSLALDENDYEEVTSVEYGLLDKSNGPYDSPMELAIVPSSNDRVRDIDFVLD